MQNLIEGATRFARIREQLERLDFPKRWQRWLYEFLLFGFKQGRACLFGGAMLALLLATHLFYPDNAPLARYDFLTLAAVAIQVAMLVLKLESWAEAKVILIFHIVGTIMELFKTANGSWIYPEASLLRIGDVPFFSGFMYAAVGSYIARVWRIFDFHYSHYPPRWATFALAAAIYVNFFAHHWLPDMRWLLFAATALLFRRTWVCYSPWRAPRRMPLRSASSSSHCSSGSPKISAPSHAPGPIRGRKPAGSRCRSPSLAAGIS